MLLFKELHGEQHGGERVWGIAGSLPVEADGIVGQFVVEGVDAGKEQVFVEPDEFFLDGAVKTFGMCVHLRASGAGQPAHSAVAGHGFGEAGFELAAVIREHPLGFEGVASFGQVPEFGGVSGVFAGNGCRWCEAAVHVLERHRIAAQAPTGAASVDFNGIHTDAFARCFRCAAFGATLPLSLHAAARGRAFPCRNQARVLPRTPARRAHARAMQPPRLAPVRQQDMQFLKPNGGHPGAQLQQALEHPLRPRHVCHDDARVRGPCCSTHAPGFVRLGTCAARRTGFDD